MIITLYLPDSRSLKDKRRIVQSILTRIRNKHRVAASEVDGLATWSKAVLGFACVANTHGHARDVLESIVRWVELNWDVDVIDSRIEIFS